jgi:hypothetical protein
MQYYIEISPWNLLESFVTESISPFSFYAERNFGNNLSRYLSGAKEKSNYLILSSEDLGGDISLVVDETLIDTTCMNPIPGMKKAFTYSQTIYYRKSLVHFRFGTNQIKDALIAESQILLEVKCLEKYLSDFYVKVKKNVSRPTISKLKESFSFEKQSYIEFDNNYNKVKGAVVGYARGLYTTSDGISLQLQNELRELKNAFGGLNTQIMMSDVFEVDRTLFERIRNTKDLYYKNIGKINSFDVLVAQYEEVIKLARMRSEEMRHENSSYGYDEKEDLLKEITDIANRISKIEESYNILEARKELSKIKATEKTNGEMMGKSRLYFKKGTVEFERKQQLKEIIKDFENGNAEYMQLSSRLDQIEQEINNDSNKYDSTLSAIFIRISDILNDLIKNASSLTNGDILDLSQVAMSDSVCLSNEQNNPEICYFNGLLKGILNASSSKQLSEYYVLQVLEESAKLFKNTPLSDTDDGKKIINALREYWLYKNQRVDHFSIPEGMPIFQSVMSFFVKPLGFDQMERYMMIKKYPNKAYAFMLWGAWVGFADMPKTFTNVIYQNNNITLMIENKMGEISRSKQEREIL